MPATIVQLPPDDEPQSAPQLISRPKAQIVSIPDDYNFNGPPVDADKVAPKRKMQLPQQTASLPEEFQSVIKVLPALGGILGGPLGAAAGATGEQALSPNPSLTQAGEDTLTQGIIPEALGKVLDPLKGLAGKIAAKFVNSNNPTVAKALGDTAESFTKSATPTLQLGQTLSEDVPGTVPPSPIQVTKKGIQPRINPDAPSSVLDDYAAGKTPEQVAKKLVSDPREVEKLNLATGTPAVTEQLALNHAVSQGYNSVSKEFDPDKILKELGTNSEGYDAALQPGTKDRLTEFLDTAKSLQPTQSTGMLSYIKHRLIFDLGAFGLGHAIAGGGLPGMAVGGGSLLLTNQAVSKLMSSETLGNLALQSLKLAPDSPVSPIVAKTLIQGLRGTELYLQNKDGKDQKVTVSVDGQLVPMK
jgi:hypothetical protein